MSSRPRIVCDVRDGYARWAQSYTSEPNPMFALEERLLARLLPPLEGLDILDLGCGTGRWLARLSQGSPGTLTGIDGSPEMLAEASRRRMPGVELLQGDCISTRLPAHAFDLLLNSFVLSHIDNLEAFAAEIARLLRPGGSAFITDLHPGTALSLQWKRAFIADGQHVEITSIFRPLEEIVSVFGSAGLEVSALLEPSISEAERWIFEHHDRADLFEAAAANPALLMLQVTRARASASERTLSVTGARMALDATESIDASLGIDGHKIAEITSQAPAASRSAIDLTGYLLLPGLINAHDHLDFALFPRMGRGNYRTASEWADDIYQPQESPIREQLAVPKDVRLWWGAIRNLLCGVTTVCHHNPPASALFDSEFPIHIVAETVWAHSLRFDDSVAEKYRTLSPSEMLIIHLAEGVGPECRNELAALDVAGALRERTILVHGLALEAEDMELLNQRAAGLVWCPTSNRFLFGKTLQAQLVRSVRRVALGSDSPLTGEGDLLDEIRAAIASGISKEEAYSLVTGSSAALFHLSQGEGRIRPNSAADLIAVNDDGATPAARLAALTPHDIELSIVGGVVRLASPRLYERLPQDCRQGLELLRYGTIERWVRAPIARLMAQVAEALPAPMLSHQPISCPGSME